MDNRIVCTLREAAQSSGDPVWWHKVLTRYPHLADQDCKEAAQAWFRNDPPTGGREPGED